MLDRVEFDVIGNAVDPRRGAAVGRDGHDLLRAAAGHGAHRGTRRGCKLIQKPELRTIYLGFDMWRDELPSSDVKGKNPLKDVRVREAFALAIDETAIARRVMLRPGAPDLGDVGAGGERLRRGAGRAAEAGPGEGEAAAGRGRLSERLPASRLDCPNDRYVMDEQICTAITSMLARIGIKVDLNAQTKAKFFAKILAPKYDTDFYLLGWTPGDL